MDLSFKIIWFEDIDEWYNALSRRITRYIEKKNLKVKIDRVKNIHDFSLNNYCMQDYDLLLVDYELEKTFENGKEVNHYGSQAINVIRQSKFVNDVLFYSSHGFDTINDVMREEGLQGVFIADRDNGEFMEMAHLLIDKAVRRSENLVNIRGIVMDTTSDFDNKIRELISIMWKFLGQKEGKISHDICKKILENNKKEAEKLCLKYTQINSENIDELLNDQSMSAYRQARLLSWCIEANEDIKRVYYKILSKYDMYDDNQTNKFFSMYKKDIINYRNILAHVKRSSEEEGAYYIGEIDGKDIVFNKELCDKLRNTLIKYEKILDELFDEIEGNF